MAIISDTAEIILQNEIRFTEIEDATISNVGLRTLLRTFDSILLDTIGYAPSQFPSFLAAHQIPTMQCLFVDNGGAAHKVPTVKYPNQAIRASKSEMCSGHPIQ